MPIKKHSISRRLVVWIAFIIFPITLFIIFENLYAINVVRNQVSISNQGTLGLYVKQIEDSLTGAENYLANLTYNNDIITQSSSGDDEYERYMQSQLLLTEVSSAKMVYPQIDGFFVVGIDDQRIIKKSNGNEKLENLEEMRIYLMDLTAIESAAYDILKGRWYGQELGDAYYLFRIYRTNDYIIGAWVNIDNLLSPLTLSEFGDDKFFAIQSNKDGILSHQERFTLESTNFSAPGSEYTLIGSRERYLRLSESFKNRDLCLVTLIPDRGVLGGLDVLQISITIMSFLTLLVLPMSIYLVNRSVIKPLSAIVQAMTKAHHGDMEAEIIDIPDYTEYNVVKETFSGMLREIKTLKIDVYEEKIEKQRAQLQYYQLQINPHFIMNALNIVYGLAQVQKYDVIQEMTLKLVAYFRSMLSMTRQLLISVTQEITHVENYLGIQQIRYPNRIDYRIDLESKACEDLIPPMVLQGLVENAVKHAVDSDRVLDVVVKVWRENQWLSMSVEDNGEGLNQDLIDRLNQWKETTIELPGHVGISNILKRINMIYGEKADVIFGKSNLGGAGIYFHLPLDSDIKKLEVE